MKKITIIKSIVLVGLILPTIASAGTFFKTGSVERILTTSTVYGKCMIQLPFNIGSTCKKNWVSLDCEGTHIDKGDGDRMLNMATIAQTMDKKVTVEVDDTKKYDGFCVATRLDLLK